MKRSIYIFAVTLCILFLTSCSGINGFMDNILGYVNDNDRVLKKAETPLVDLSYNYDLKKRSITTFYDEQYEVPYVDIKAFFSDMKGYIDSRHIYAKFDKRDSKLYFDNQGAEMIVDWNSNYIYFDNYNFINFTEETKTDYVSHLAFIEPFYDQGDGVIFNLNDYNFDIMYYQGKCLVPFHIVNLLLCSNNMFNLYYNGEAYYGVDYNLYNVDDEDFAKIVYPLYGKARTNQFIKNNNNFMNFTFDYFYGLKDYKEINSFNEFTLNYHDSLYSPSNLDYNKAIFNIIYKEIDELHTRISNVSFYTVNDDIDFLDDSIYGIRANKFFDTSEQLDKLYYERFGKSGAPIVRFIKDTAIINLEEFVTGENEDIYDSKGNVKPDAYKYDTYWLFYEAFQQISRVSGITNVVIDLSRNGGGNIAALMKALTFLTDEVISLPTYDVLKDEYMIEYIKGDTDNDGSFDDADAYDNYHYYVLASDCTFSAANLFTSICRDMNLATIIGQKSGGGMCAVLSVPMFDGMTIDMSSTYTLRSVLDQSANPVIFNEIESGVPVNINISLNNFYNDEILIKYLR